MQSLSLVNRINWEEKYTDLKPAWYENPKVLKVARERIAEVAGTLAVGATFVYFCKVATPMVIMGTFWGVGIGLTACAVAAFVVSHLLAHRNPWALPEYKREQAQKIAQEIVEQKLPYLEIQKRYDNLPIKQALFTNSEWNELVFEREAVSANSYDAFIQRNGSESLKMLEKGASKQVQTLFIKKQEEERRQLVAKLEEEYLHLPLRQFVEKYERVCASLQLPIEPYCKKIIEQQVKLLFNGTLSHAQFVSNNGSSSYLQNVIEALSPTKKEFFSAVNNLERQASYKKEGMEQETTRRLNHYTWGYERDKTKINTRLDGCKASLNPLEQALHQAEQELLTKKNLLSNQTAEQASYRHAEEHKVRLAEEIQQKEAALAHFDQQGRESQIAQKRLAVEKIKNTEVQGVPAARAAIAQMDSIKNEIKVLEKELATHNKEKISLNHSKRRFVELTSKAATAKQHLAELKGVIESTHLEIARARQQCDLVKHLLESTKRHLAPEIRILEHELKCVQDRYTQDCHRVRGELQQELSCIARRLAQEQEAVLQTYRQKA